MNPWKSLCLALLLAPLCAHAAPELNVGGLYDYLAGGKSTLLKRVRTGGDSTAFVKVAVVELVYDKNGVAQEVELEGLPLEQRPQQRGRAMRAPRSAQSRSPRVKAGPRRVGVLSGRLGRTGAGCMAPAAGAAARTARSCPLSWLL